MDPNTWNGLTGKEVREKIQNIEKQANDTDKIVINLFNEEEKIKSEYLPSYIDDTVEGKIENNKFYPYDIENQKYSEPIEQGEKSKIYYNRENLTSYRWSGSKYIKIVNGDEIQQRLDNFSIKGKLEGSIEKIVDNKVDKDGEKQLTTNDYTDAEMHKIRVCESYLIAKNLEDLQNGQLLYFKQPSSEEGITYPFGLYEVVSSLNKIVRKVGGLL